MAKNTASLELLAQLHSVLAETMLQRLRTNDYTAADLAAIGKFLKDNGIQAVAGEDENINKIVDELPFDEDDSNVITFGG